MSATEEVEAPTVEAPPATEEKPVREKKLRDLKEKKPKQPKTAAHPPYFQMITEALLALNEKSGSSPYAIAKYMEEKHEAVLPANFKKTLALQLKNSEARGKLVKVRASYKLSEAGKEDKSASKRTTRASKPKEEEKKNTKTKASAAPKVTKKKPAKKNKKSSAAKPKQPKSIKSPAAKKPKKAAA
ncbi:histone H1 [Rosa rugosa]|uniref:histone H1 n=1 Tax=Rosa rugosa TaxID=74645 RepID=UPI002B41269E|nr:histone H1 [Rosa rugosa]